MLQQFGFFFLENFAHFEFKFGSNVYLKEKNRAQQIFQQNVYRLPVFWRQVFFYIQFQCVEIVLFFFLFFGLNQINWSNVVI